MCIVGAYESGKKLKEVEVDVDEQFPHIDPYNLSESEGEEIIRRASDKASLPKSVDGDGVSLEIERVEEWIDIG